MMDGYRVVEGLTPGRRSSLAGADAVVGGELEGWCGGWEWGWREEEEKAEDDVYEYGG